MPRIFTALALATTTILLALGSINGLVPAQMAETAVLALPALAVATLRPAKCCNPLKGLRA